MIAERFIEIHSMLLEKQVWEAKNQLKSVFLHYATTSAIRQTKVILSKEKK